ncbi:MAG: hypothetical protein K9J30_06045 [Bacteroidales bacterium]|nr:hypothetical protein [Bacteroidales bacterium]
MKLICFLVPFMLLNTFYLSGQNLLNENGKKIGHWKGYYPDSTLKYEGSFINGKPVGTMKRYDIMGVLSATMDFYPGTDRCYAVIYTGRGKVGAEGVYDTQLKDSVWTYYGNNGTVRLTETYNRDTLHGNVEFYYPSENKSQQLHYDSGIKDGPWIKFFENGDTMLITSYNNGILSGPYRTFYPEKKMQISGVYIDDVKDGDWKYFDENGDTIMILKYRMGDLLNPEVLEDQYEEFLEFEQNDSMDTDVFDEYIR